MTRISAIGYSGDAGRRTLLEEEVGERVYSVHLPDVAPGLSIAMCATSPA